MKSGVGDLKNHSGEWITGDKDKADELNSFFGSVFTKNESDELPEFLSDVGSSVCDIFSCTQSQIYVKILKHFQIYWT